MMSNKKIIVVEHELYGKCEFYPDRIPCIHPGCVSHKTHPCEYCGRIESKNDAYIPIILKIEK